MYNKTVHQTDAFTKQKKQLQLLRGQLKFAHCGFERKNAMKAVWRCLRLVRRLSAMKQLTAMKKHWKQDLFTPIVFRVDGKLSYDRSEWLIGAASFGSARFGDPGNGVAHQLRRLDSAVAIASCDRLDGKRDPALEFWDTLQARAELKSGSAAGIDGNTPDVYLQLPFVGIAQIHRLFQQRSELKPMLDSSIHWKILQFVGLPKETCVRDLEGLRWICKSAVLQKLYL